LRAAVIDELVIYYAPMILGDKGQALFALPEWTSLDQALRPKVVDVRAVGNDIRVTARMGT
jgi:diaminohydroxyphosphoribosylaminopyrimidine deaminase/5-amino-6-(5-phosphoribosylamino)uracil reductase